MYVCMYVYMIGKFQDWFFYSESDDSTVPTIFFFFKVPSFTLNTFLQRFINFSDTWNRLFYDIPFSTAAVAFLTPSFEENLFPRSCLFSVGNAQKSHGATFGLYGGCFSAVPPISVIAANATAAICGRALSWSKNHCFLSKSGLFFLMAPRKWVFRTFV